MRIARYFGFFFNSTGTFIQDFRVLRIQKSNTIRLHIEYILLRQVYFAATYLIQSAAKFFVGVVVAIYVDAVFHGGDTDEGTVSLSYHLEEEYRFDHMDG